MYFRKKCNFWQGNLLIEFNTKDEKPISDLHFACIFDNRKHKSAFIGIFIEKYM